MAIPVKIDKTQTVVYQKQSQAAHVPAFAQAKLKSSKGGPVIVGQNKAKLPQQKQAPAIIRGSDPGGGTVTHPENPTIAATTIDKQKHAPGTKFTAPHTRATAKKAFAEKKEQESLEEARTRELEKPDKSTGVKSGWNAQVTKKTRQERADEYNAPRPTNALPAEAVGTVSTTPEVAAAIAKVHGERAASAGPGPAPAPRPVAVTVGAPAPAPRPITSVAGMLETNSIKYFENWVEFFYVKKSVL